MKDINCDWIDFYTEFATKLLFYQAHRNLLIEKIRAVFENIHMKFPISEKDNPLQDIDPFTVFGLFNKNIKESNRIAILTEIATSFAMTAHVPQNFDAIPTVHHLQATFYGQKGKQKEADIDHLWALFSVALAYADNKTEQNKAQFAKWFDVVTKQNGIKWNITMGLYWIRPNHFISLDSRNRKFLCQLEHMPQNFVTAVDGFKQLPSGEQYLWICDLSLDMMQNESYAYHTFAEFSYHAWLYDTKQYQKMGKAHRFFVLPKQQIKSIRTIQSKYQKTDFCREVYVSEQTYETWIQLLKRKKNIILQGPAGVGKTFVAIRLAYAMAGKQSQKQIQMVQFHQNYSYEDFMMGFRPTDTRFALQTGVFYRFCKMAEQDKHKPYIFIIDEINRGNLSKIFGELFMLLEQDKRGTSLRLLYTEESFTIPENVYIIGTMNTSDRSLAMVDYALRRRFAFLTLQPAFLSDGFQTYQKQMQNQKLDRLIDCIQNLNDAIAQDEMLGEGFVIGHSYFCTKEPIDDGYLSAVVEYECIPLLQEYWFDEPQKIQHWSDRLRSAIQ